MFTKIKTRELLYVFTGEELTDEHGRVLRVMVHRHCSKYGGRGYTGLTKDKFGIGCTCLRFMGAEWKIDFIHLPKTTVKTVMKY